MVRRDSILEDGEMPPPLDSIKPPPMGFGEPEEEPEDPMKYVPKAVTSAHAVDVASSRISALDSAAFAPSGSVVHGKFGDLGDAAAQFGVPLEYLALLGPAAEGVAALREIDAETGGKGGTILVYGATRPAGMTAAQLATSSGRAVVAVVDGQHSGNDEMVAIVKGMMSEPGTAVAEEYALCKGNFRDLVQRITSGEEFTSDGFDSDVFLKDFQANLSAYAETYPSDLPAAVDAKHLEFLGKEKDRANFRINMDAYLSQFPAGAPPIDKASLEANFDVEQYDLFKKKFGVQTTAVVSGGDGGTTDITQFAPAEIVSDMTARPEPVPTADKSGDFPYEFSVKRSPTATTSTTKGGPIAGAVVQITPELEAACKAVAAAGDSLRAKAEALQFLTDGERNAHAAASAVVAMAREAGVPVRTVGGSVAGLDAVGEPGKEDAMAALEAMGIGEDGTSRLNYFLQVYRAGDFPVYEDYAVHRASEPLAGPRQFVVTK